MRRIYFDNSSTTPLLPEVIAKMMEVMTNHFGNPSSIHFHGRNSRALLEEARKKIAKAIQASVSEIFFTSSATEANNTVLLRAVEDLGIDTIITSPTEHHCVYNTVNVLQQEKKISVIYLNVDSKGNINYNELDRVLSHSGNQKMLVSLMHGNNEIGTIHDIEIIGSICKSNKAYFHTDTVQTIGKLPLDVSNGNIHFLSASAHKFHGPKGVGFLYMNSDSILKPLLHGGAQERNFRAGTENIIGIVGMAEALHIATLEMENRNATVRNLKSHFIQRLLHVLPSAYVNSHIDERGLNHIVSVSFPPGPKADMIMYNLDINGVSVSSGSACSSGIEHDSHILTAIGHDSKRKTIRFSFSYMNTIIEVDEVISIIEKLNL